MHVGRRRPEQANSSISEFYRQLHLIRNQIKNSDFTMCDITQAWADNPTHDYYIAWIMSSPVEKLVFVVNYGSTQGQCYIQLSNFLNNFNKPEVEFVDIVDNKKEYTRKMDEIKNQGLFIDLQSYGFHIFRIV